MIIETINLSTANIAQAKADIKQFRQIGTPEAHEAAELLQDAVDRAQLIRDCPELFHSGSLTSKGHRIVWEAVLFAGGRT